MLVKELELRDFCQHVHFHEKLRSGLIGVYGSNGSGKSNAFNIGCYAALTGDFSRHSRNKSGCVRLNCENPAGAFVRVVAEHNDVEFEILRYLSKSQQRMQIRDGETLTKSADIQAALQSILGASRALLDDYVFVPQWKLFEFLTAPPAKRIDLFAQLCSAALVERCRTAVERRSSLDRKYFVQSVDNSDELSERRRVLSEERRALTLKRAELQRRLLSDGEIERLTKIADAARLCREFLTRMAAARRSWRDLQPRLHEAKTVYLKAAKAHRRLQKAEQSIAETRNKIERFRSVENELKRKREYAARVKENLEVERKALSATKWNLETFEARAASLRASCQGRDKKELRKQVAAYKVELKAAQQLVERFNNTGLVECPTCGTPVANLLSRVGEARDAIHVLRDAIKTAEVQLAECDQADSAEQAAMTYRYKLGVETKSAEHRAEELQRAEAEVEATKQAFDKCAIPGGDVDQIEKTLRSAAAALSDATTTLAHAKTTYRRLLDSRVSLRSEFEASRRSALKYRPARNSNSSAVRRQLAENTLLREKLASLDARVSSIGQELTGLDKMLRDLAERKAREATQRDWLGTLERATAVLHRDAMQRELIYAALRLAEDTTNEYLEAFESPFLLRTDEDLGFQAVFSDKTVSGGELSGGQMVTAAMAFRLAVNSLFASQIGMLILDEPTSGLDARNFDCMEKTLRGMHRAISASDRQVIVVTHSEQLSRIFDQIIRLEPSVS